MAPCWLPSPPLSLRSEPRWRFTFCFSAWVLPLELCRVSSGALLKGQGAFRDAAPTRLPRASASLKIQDGSRQGRLLVARPQKNAVTKCCAPGCRAGGGIVSTLANLRGWWKASDRKQTRVLRKRRWCVPLPGNHRREALPNLVRSG